MVFCFDGFLNSVVQWPPFSPFFLVAAPLKWSSQKRVPFFSGVTEQLSISGKLPHLSEAICSEAPGGADQLRAPLAWDPQSGRWFPWTDSPDPSCFQNPPPHLEPWLQPTF